MQDLSISSQDVLLQRSALNLCEIFLSCRDSTYLDEVFRLQSDDNSIFFFHRCHLFDTMKRISAGRVLSNELFALGSGCPEEHCFAGYQALLSCPCNRTNIMVGRTQRWWNDCDSGQRKYGETSLFQCYFLLFFFSFISSFFLIFLHASLY